MRAGMPIVLAPPARLSRYWRMTLRPTILGIRA
jgi:hypothetical protein